MPKFIKQKKSVVELVNELKEKGLHINDNIRTLDYVRNIGYFRLKSYFYPLYTEPKNKHLFKTGQLLTK